MTDYTVQRPNIFTMETSSRLEKVAVSQLSKNKKLQETLDFGDQFVRAIHAEKDNLPAAKPFDDPEERKMLEGRDISVCVRVRPMHDYERRSGFFTTVEAANPKVHAIEPRLDVRRRPKTVRSTYDVDYAFGPEHGNADVYDALAAPLIDLGLKGGVCTLLAYGQTGSGKTHTIGGVLDRLGEDLFTGDDNGLRLFVSFVELLGNDASDLLNADKKKVEIVEDQFGKTVMKNASEVEVKSGREFAEVVSRAMDSRRTETTFKNDTSSRSHAVCCVRVRNTRFLEAEDGKIFVVDLAGSETAADAQFHDRSRLDETRLINASLMALKECIRNRALSATHVDRYYHVPYRQSRLTLLLKDAFEVESHRHCKTVFVACVSPSVADMAMTMNTLRYVAPIKIGEVVGEKTAPNPDNPANWSNAVLKEWVAKRSNGKIDPEALCRWESGMQMLRVPETEFIGRILQHHPAMGEKKAKLFYVSLWKLLIDARTKERKEKTRRRVVHIDYGAVPDGFDVEVR